MLILVTKWLSVKISNLKFEMITTVGNKRIESFHLAHIWGTGPAWVKVIVHSWTESAIQTIKISENGRVNK